MALMKEIEQANGIVLSYHRIASVSSQVNEGTSIVVVSYISQQKRDDERSSLEAGEPMDVFMESKIYQTDYRDGMTAEEAYNYIKTVPDFEGSSDC